MSNKLVLKLFQSYRSRHRRRSASSVRLRMEL